MQTRQAPYISKTYLDAPTSTSQQFMPPCLPFTIVLSYYKTFYIYLCLCVHLFFFFLSLCVFALVEALRVLNSLELQLEVVVSYLMWRL